MMGCDFIKPKLPDFPELGGVRCGSFGSGAGISALLDDRDESPGSKFAESELLGYPTRVVVGRKFKSEGHVEIRRRRDGHDTTATPDDAVAAVREALESAQPGD